MAKNAAEKMLVMISKGKVPSASDLAVSKEEYVKLVSDAVQNGYLTFSLGKP